MKKVIFLTFSLVFLFACKENVPVVIEKVVEEDPIEIVMEREGIKLTSDQNATEYKDASLSLIAPEGGSVDAGVQNFRFEIANYELGVNTSDVLSGQCANSGKGQHIHYIMNNQPYSAYYEAEFEQNMPVGHNVLLAFLSRSYHMSVKEANSFVLKEYTTDNYAEDNFDETAPHLFYSRPKGEYVGADANKVMLDFFLLNTDLKDQGYTVTATINGVDFELTDWMPYFIEGLEEGENTIGLALKDATGSLVESPFNPVERKINVKFSEESI